MQTISLIFFLLFTAQAFAADNVIVNPRPNEDTVLKVYNQSEPTKPADGTQELLRLKGADSTAIFANGVGSTDSSDSSPVIDSGETVSKSNLTIPAAETWTVNGALNTTGLVTGAGSIAGTGSVASVDAGQNGDDVTFAGDVDFTSDVDFSGTINGRDGADFKRVMIHYERRDTTAIAHNTSIEFPVQISDSTDGSWSGSVFTVPFDGDYTISSSLTLNNVAVTVGNFIGIDLYVNAVRSGRLDIHEFYATQTVFQAIKGSITRTFSAGDVISIVSNFTGGSYSFQSASGICYVSIVKVN